MGPLHDRGFFFRVFFQLLYRGVLPPCVPLKGSIDYQVITLRGIARPIIAIIIIIIASRAYVWARDPAIFHNSRIRESARDKGIVTSFEETRVRRYPYAVRNAHDGYNHN